MIDTEDIDLLLTSGLNRAISTNWPEHFVAHVIDNDHGVLHFEPTGMDLGPEPMRKLRQIASVFTERPDYPAGLAGVAKGTVAIAMGYRASIRRETRLLVAVDLWGCVHGVVRLKGSGGPIKANLKRVGDPIFSLALIVRSLSPWVREEVDPTALDKLIEECRPSDDLPGGKKWKAGSQ